MSRDLYLSFSNDTLITADNTTDFTVTTYYFSGTPINLINQFDSSVSPYFDSGYDVLFSAFTQNKAVWQIGLFNDQISASAVIPTVTNTQLRSNSFFITVDCGCGLINVASNSGPCNTSAYGEVVNVTPDQDGEAYVHHDLTQVTSVNGSLAPALPSIVVKAFNGNYPTTAASGDTVTATLYVTGVTYVTGGTSSGETTTYTDVMVVTHPGWATNPSPEISQTFDLINSTYGIHRGLWTFELHVSTNNSNSGHELNKYARAYFINNSCG